MLVLLYTNEICPTLKCGPPSLTPPLPPPSQVCMEVLRQPPPNLLEEEHLSSLVRFIYKGRQLTRPTLSLGELKVKDNDRIMVLCSKTFSAAVQQVGWQGGLAGRGGGVWQEVKQVILHIALSLYTLFLDYLIFIAL